MQFLLRLEFGVDDKQRIFDTVVWEVLWKALESFPKALEFIFDTIHGGANEFVQSMRGCGAFRDP